MRVSSSTAEDATLSTELESLRREIGAVLGAGRQDRGDAQPQRIVSRTVVWRAPLVSVASSSDCGLGLTSRPAM